MFLRIRRPRIASLCLSAVVASFGATSAQSAEPTITPGSLFPSSQPEVIQQTAASLQEIQREDLPQLINDAVSITSRRYLTADVHTPWQIMHGLLALRDEYKIKVDGEKVSALNWLTERRSYKGQPIIEHTPHGGRFHTFTEPYAFEGHPNQFLAIATMSELTVDFAFKTTVGGQVTIQDMIDNAKADVTVKKSRGRCGLFPDTCLSTPNGSAPLASRGVSNGSFRFRPTPIRPTRLAAGLMDCSRCRWLGTRTWQPANRCEASGWKLTRRSNASLPNRSLCRMRTERSRPNTSKAPAKVQTSANASRLRDTSWNF
jgi:hypothetical protein